MVKHPDTALTWPADVIARRLERILEDGIITSDERDDLQILLGQVTGSDAASAALANRASGLPLDEPAPTIEFEGRAFCFTGKFYYGMRRSCQAAVADRGGESHSGVTTKTDYVVVGLLGSRDWIHAGWGTKIEKAIEYRDSTGLAIVGEDHWAASL